MADCCVSSHLPCATYEWGETVHTTGSTVVREACGVLGRGNGVELLKRIIRTHSPNLFKFLKHTIRKQSANSCCQSTSNANGAHTVGETTFDEQDYLSANSDVAEAVKQGIFPSGRDHYETYGRNEKRRLRSVPSPSDRIVIRKSLRSYLAGHGIEIGALHNPLDISGLSVTSIKFVDRMSSDELQKHYPELRDVTLVPVDIIDNGEVLETIEPDSLDFIIANHFIEHARNPMGTIRNWLSKLRRGGTIFMAVPDKNHTFDRDRALTPLEHLIADYRSDLTARLSDDRQHFVEWAARVNKVPVDDVESRVTHLMAMDYSIHFHTFTLESFLDMLHHLKHECMVPFAIKACADNADEFVVILARE